MTQEQVYRVAKSLIDLMLNNASVYSIGTELLPDSDDPDFLDPVVSIKYHRDGQTEVHEIRVYDDGSMSDF